MTLRALAAPYDKVKRWIAHESGALAIDWTLAATVAVGLVLTGATLLFASTDTADATAERNNPRPVVAGKNLVTNGAFDPEGFQWVNGHFVNFDNTLAGWEIHANAGTRVEILPSSHYGFTRELLGSAGYLLDTMGAAGQAVSLSQTIELAAGASATLHFNAGSVSATHQTQVYWGNELLGTLNARNAPLNALTRFEFHITGGSGDGSNSLRFETSAGTGYAGTLLHDVRIH